MAGVTLREIALKSGVSYQTVSRILNNQSKLHKAETVERVQKIARELGYRPNLNARGVQTGKTRMIGILNGFGCNSFIMNLMFGTHDELLRTDYLPIMLMTRPGLCSELDQIHRLVDRRVDGVILRPVMHEVSDQYLREVWERRIPMVTVDIEVPETQHIDFVGTNDVLGGRLAAKHLLELGHRNLAFVSWFMHLIMKQERLRGFHEEVKQVDGADLNTRDVDFDPEHNAARAIKELLDRPNRPTAIFAGTDDIACGVYAAAAELGLRIPEDLSVIGYSDMDFTSSMAPGLTTLRQDPYRIGSEAVKLLLQRVEGKVIDPKPRIIKFDPELVVRDSTRAIR